MKDDFEPREEMFTAVYDTTGVEIDRLDGIVTIRPQDYEKYLPITYKHFKVTTELLSKIKVEK